MSDIDNSKEAIKERFFESMREAEERRIKALENYGPAVAELAEMCLNHDGSGAYAAVQVLLGTYNSRNYQLDMVDLCSLDYRNYALCMDVINGRVHAMREPHEMLQNGREVFNRLEERWSGLHVTRRYKRHYAR